MKKIYLRLTVFAVAFATTLGIYYYLDNRYYYKSGQNGSYNLGTGEDFIIKLDENGSTGYSNCWLDIPTGIILVNDAYAPYWYSQKDCDGCGGITTYTFKATKPGTYTLAAAICPPEKNGAVENAKPANIFTIEVTE